jgi:TonB dependent receptor-like, beta-barrel/Carboxypeptidase regulatory-like domain
LSIRPSSRIGALLLVAGLVPAARASEHNGTLAGWVEDSRGLPVAGAVISLFGGGIGSGGMVTLSDSAGRFVLPSLPAGSYTLRALSGSDLAAPARQVTVLPNKDSVFSISMRAAEAAALAEDSEDPEDDAAGAKSKATSEASRELRWLLRHKRRSVLEARTAAPDSTSGDEADVSGGGNALTGSVEVATAPLSFGSEPVPGDAATPVGLGVLRLEGKLADLGHWSLGGLVAESEDTTWRMAAEFLIEPGGGHALRAGSGYGLRYHRGAELSEATAQPDSRNLGAMFVEDRWKLSKHFTAQAGLRYSFVGFVKDGNLLDPSLALEAHGHKTRIRGAFSSHTLVPGGDFLTLSTISAAPAIAISQPAGLRPERLLRYEVLLDRQLGSTTLGLHAYREHVDGMLMNAFAPSGALQVWNGPEVSARGVGLFMARQIGNNIRGSVSYTYGRASRRFTGPLLPWPEDLLSDGSFHDIVAELEATVEPTDTRLVALYRIHSAHPDGEAGQPTPAVSRFDVQLTQGLPFLGSLTRADWEFLLAFRNLLYEVSDQAGVLDEVAVANPPKRIVGGISVRF